MSFVQLLVIIALGAVKSFASNSTTPYSNSTYSSTTSTPSSSPSSSSSSSSSLTVSLTLSSSFPSLSASLTSSSGQTVASSTASSSSAASLSFTETHFSFNGTSAPGGAASFSGSGSAAASLQSNAQLNTSGAITRSSLAIESGSVSGIRTVSAAATSSRINGLLTNTTIAANGTTNATYAAAQSCNAASLSYISQYAYWSTGVVTETLHYQKLTYYPPAGATPYTTLCDGKPRAHGSATFTTTNVTSTYTASSAVSRITPNNTARPSCTIDSAACSYLYSSASSSWNSARSVYSANTISATFPNFTSPACQSPSPTTTSACIASTNSVPCAVTGGPVQLAYWPVTVAGNLCGNRSTIQPNITTPRVASIWGTTVTSPGVLVSFGSLYAVDACRTTVGTPLVDYILPQQTAQISSQCGLYHAGLGAGRQVNFADFNSPVPWSAYSCLPQCGGDGAGGVTNYCSTIYDDFLPNLAFPTDVFKVEPEWKTCYFDFMGDIVYDPPTALTPTSTAAGVTTNPGQGQASASPTPASNAAPTTPTATSTPVAQADSATASLGQASIAGPSGTSPNAANPSTSPQADPAASASPAAAQPTSSSVNLGGVIASVLNPSTAQPNQPAVSTSVNAGGVIASLLASSNNGAAQATTTAAGGGNGQQPATSPIATVGSQTIAADPSSSGGVVVGGSTTLQPGQSTTINNTPVSVGTGQVVVGSSTLAVPTANAGSGSGATAAPNAAAVLSIGNTQVTAVAVGSSGAVQIAGQTLTPGQTTVINGQTVIGASTALVVNGNTLPLSQGVAAPTTASGAIITAGSQTLTAVSSNGAVIIQGQTLTPGQTATINGQIISDASTGLVIAGSTAAFSQITIAAPTPGPITSGVVFTAGSQTISASESGGTVVILGQTLTPGQVTVINGQTVRDVSSGLVIGTSTALFSQIAGDPSNGGAQSSGAVLTVGSQTITAFETGGTATVNGHVLTPGQVTVINGQTISDASSALVVNGKTVPFSLITQGPITEAIFTVGTDVLTATELANGYVVINGTTLSRGGPAVTIDGQVVSDGLSGLVVGSKTLPFSTVGATSAAPSGIRTSGAIQTYRLSLMVWSVFTASLALVILVICM